MVLVLQGCTRSGSTNVLGGAYYPGWLFCIVGAILTVIVLRPILLFTGLDDWLDPQAVGYPSLVALLALLGWLLFY